MSDPPVVIGIPELDRELAPSLPPGWLALAVGSADSSTHLLAKQFAHAGVGESPVHFYTTYERTEDIARVFGDFGWKTDGVRVVNLAQEYYDRVLSRELEVSRTRERGIRYSDLAPSKGLDESTSRTFNLTNRLFADLAALDGRFRLVLDSLDFLLEVLEGQSVMTVSRQIRQRAQGLGGRALLVVQAGIHDAPTIGLLQDLADLVLEFGIDVVSGELVHSLTIRKVRNHPERATIVRTRTGAHGLEVVREPRVP